MVKSRRCAGTRLNLELEVLGIYIYRCWYEYLFFYLYKYMKLFELYKMIYNHLRILGDVCHHVSSPFGVSHGHLKSESWETSWEVWEIGVAFANTDWQCLTYLPAHVYTCSLRVPNTYYIHMSLQVLYIVHIYLYIYVYLYICNMYSIQYFCLISRGWVAGFFAANHFCQHKLSARTEVSWSVMKCHVSIACIWQVHDHQIACILEDRNWL